MARSYRIEPRQQAKQSTFPAAGCAHNRDKLSCGNRKADIPQNFNCIGTVVNCLKQTAYLNCVRSNRGRVHVNLEDVEKKRSSVIFAAALYAVAVLLATNCGEKPAAPTQEQRTEPAPSSTSTATPLPEGPVIVTFGDSLTAGVAGRSYPDNLQDLLQQHGYKYRVDNQGVSGDTTTDGLARIDNVIAA